MQSKFLLSSALFLVTTVMSAQTVFPITVNSVIGSVSNQPIDVLSLQDQSELENDWNKYIELSTDPAKQHKSTYTFSLDEAAQSCQNALFHINTLSEARGRQKWDFSIKNAQSGQYETVLGNTRNDWVWSSQQYNFNDFAPYISSNGTVDVQVSCKRNCTVMDIDYMSFDLSKCGDTPPPEPPAIEHYNLQFNETDNLVTDGFDVIDIDMEDTSADTIASLKEKGLKVICYFSAGSYEGWRSDAADFPPEVLGNSLSGWPDEKWLDIRRIDLLQPIMTARMDSAKAKGCDGVDPDNVDAFTNNTGLDLTYDDQITYNTMLASEAHDRGLLVALKNDVAQLNDLVSSFDFAINESCYNYNECGGYDIFIEQEKPVHIIEYKKHLFNVNCSDAKSHGFDMILKDRSLDAFVKSCY